MTVDGESSEADGPGHESPDLRAYYGALETAGVTEVIFVFGANRERAQNYF